MNGSQHKDKNTFTIEGIIIVIITQKAIFIADFPIINLLFNISNK
jgi:hypothetical protein